MLSNNSGSYCLELYAKQEFEVVVGKNHNLKGLKGFYYYIGSAFGPGGLRSRIAHHCGVNVKPHWHIDYIKSAIPIIAIAYAYQSIKHEHQWAEILRSNGFLGHAGIGASDCHCESHFFYGGTRPRPNWYKLLKADLISIEKDYESV